MGNTGLGFFWKPVEINWLAVGIITIVSCTIVVLIYKNIKKRRK